MSLRSFVDSRGTVWRVWATHVGAIGEPVVQLRAGGWLTFDSVVERRRLVPIPEDWLSASPAALEAYRDSAEAVPVHLGDLPKDVID